MTNAELRGLLREARETLRDLAENWDCDTDAHKYGTTCRVCAAQTAKDRLDAALAEKQEEVKWRKVGGGLASVEVSHIATIGDIEMEVYDLDAPIPVLWEVKSTFAKQGYAPTVEEAKDAAVKAVIGSR